MADEIAVNPMLSTCGLGFAEAEPEIELVEFDGVEIPLASASLLHRMKQTGSERDRLDLLFVEERIRRGDSG